MTGETPEEASTGAVDHLTAFGLSTYAARTYVTLVRLGGGTAQEVSEVGDVPRTRVYDAAEELQEVGLVDVHQSTPKQFWPVSAETTGRYFQRQYERRVERLTASLDALEPVSRSVEQRGVWTVTSRDAVTDRVIDFVDDATDEIVFMSVAALLTDDVVDRLAAASDRGVTVTLGGISDDVEGEIRERVDGVNTFDSIWVWSDTHAGRLLMVDESKTLASVLVDGSGEHPPGPRDETAIWGSGERNSLVVVLRAMFTWQLDGTRD